MFPPTTHVRRLFVPTVFLVYLSRCWPNKWTMLFDYVVSSETGKTGGKPWPSSNIEEERRSKRKKTELWGRPPRLSIDVHVSAGGGYFKFCKKGDQRWLRDSVLCTCPLAFHASTYWKHTLPPQRLLFFHSTSLSTHTLEHHQVLEFFPLVSK